GQLLGGRRGPLLGGGGGGGHGAIVRGFAHISGGYPRVTAQMLSATPGCVFRMPEPPAAAARRPRAGGAATAGAKPHLRMADNGGATQDGQDPCSASAREWSRRDEGRDHRRRSRGVRGGTG